MFNEALFCLGPIFYITVLFLLPYAKAVIMTRMNWAPLDKSFKHAFWINITIIAVLYLDAVYWQTDRIIYKLIVPFFFPSLSPEVWLFLTQIVHFLHLIVLIVVVEATILTGLLFALNRTEPYRRAWFMAAMNIIISIIFLLIFMTLSRL